LATVIELGDSALECDVLINLGEMYRWNGQDQLARDVLRRAEALAPQHRDPQIPASLALNTGILHHRAGDNAAAADSLQEALELFRTLGDRGNQIDTLTALAAVHRTQEAVEDAHERLGQAEQLLAEIDDTQRRSRLEAEIGQLLLLERHGNEARSHLNKAVELARYASAPLEEAHARRALGDTLTSLGDAPEGHLQQQLAYAILRRLGHADAT
jgi:tetratricopeptide (TPR) repeat protein